MATSLGMAASKMTHKDLELGSKPFGQKFQYTEQWGKGASGWPGFLAPWIPYLVETGQEEGQRDTPKLRAQGRGLSCSSLREVL